MTAQQRLSEFFSRNGVLRTPDLKRRKTEKQQYHQGYEIRLVAFDQTELNQIRRALKVVKIKAGNSFEKSRRTVVPIYGKDQVRRFLMAVNAPADDLPEALRP